MWKKPYQVQQLKNGFLQKQLVSAVSVLQNTIRNSSANSVWFTELAEEFRMANQTELVVVIIATLYRTYQPYALYAQISHKEDIYLT